MVLEDHTMDILKGSRGVLKLDRPFDTLLVSFRNGLVYTSGFLKLHDSFWSFYFETSGLRVLTHRTGFVDVEDDTLFIPLSRVRVSVQVLSGVTVTVS